jgi:hypothetical protein
VEEPCTSGVTAWRGAPLASSAASRRPHFLPPLGWSGSLCRPPGRAVLARSPELDFTFTPQASQPRGSALTSPAHPSGAFHVLAHTTPPTPARAAGGGASRATRSQGPARSPALEPRGSQSWRREPGPRLQPPRRAGARPPRGSTAAKPSTRSPASGTRPLSGVEPGSKPRSTGTPLTRGARRLRREVLRCKRQGKNPPGREARGVSFFFWAGLRARLSPFKRCTLAPRSLVPPRCFAVLCRQPPSSPSLSSPIPRRAVSPAHRSSLLGAFIKNYFQG